MNASIKTKAITGLVAIAAAAPLIFAQPAFAGYWSLTGTPTGSYLPGTSGSALQSTPGQSSISFSAFGLLNNASLTETGTFIYTGTVKWVPNGSLSSDPQPASFTLTESSTAEGNILYANTSDLTYAADGLGDVPVTNYTTGYPGNTLATTSSGTHTTVVPVSSGSTYTFTRVLVTYAWGTQLDEGHITYSASVK